MATPTPATRSAAGTAVLLLRDSQGRSDQSFVQYLPWVRQEAARLGLKFRGDEAAATRMVRDRLSADGDIYLDYGVSGNDLLRPGLAALRRRVEADPDVSHVFVPRRDRMARPDNPMDAMKIEFEIRMAGVCIVTLDKVLKPLQRGSRIEVVELLTSMLEYDSSGRFRTELAQKLILAKVKLAESGFSIGGEPPYGFRRWLVDAGGARRRELERGEYVKMPGHHVVWLPTAEGELAVVARILGEILAKPAHRLANELNAEGVPSPKAGRGRRAGKYSTVAVPNSGLWTQTTVRNIAAHPLYAAVCEVGRRCSGDQLRMTSRGARALNDSDYRDGRLVAVENPKELRIEAAGKFEPLLSAEAHRRIVTTLEGRGRHLKGKPRARGGVANAMGGRIFDMNCGWPMYRDAKGKKWCYSCGLYMSTSAKCCSRNAVKGEAATRLVLAAIRQRMQGPGMIDRLRAKLTEAAAGGGPDRPGESRAAAERDLAQARQRQLVSGKNMAMAASPEQFRAIADVYDEAGREVARLEGHLGSLPAAAARVDPAAEVEAALAALARLTDFASEGAEHPGVSELLRGVDARLYLKFAATQQGRRAKSVPSGGVLTFGSTPPPVPLYAGKTAGAIVRQMLANGEPVSAGLGSGSPTSSHASAEVQSSGNVPRVTSRFT